MIEQFQLSKNSVRKGLDALVQLQLIEKIPNIGTKVLGARGEGLVHLRFGFHPSLISECGMLELIDRFNKSNDNVVVEPVPYKNDLDLDIRNQLQRDNLDLICATYHDYALLARTGTFDDALEPVQIREGTYPFLTRPFQWEGVDYAQPFIFSPIVLCYNREHFREAGLSEPDSSWTWEEVRDVAQQLSRPGSRIGILFNVASINRWPIFPLQNQVEFNRDEHGNLQVSNLERFREAIDMASGLFDSADALKLIASSEGDRDIEIVFASEKVSMIITSYYRLNLLADKNLDFDIAPLPYVREPKTLLTVLGLSIMRYSKHKHAARQFVEYLLSDEIQRHLSTNTLNLPALKRASDASAESVVRKPNRFMMYRDIIPTYRYFSDMSISPTELVAMRMPLKMYWSNLVDFDTLCEMIAKIPGNQMHSSVDR